MLIALWKAHILKLHPSSWRCNLKIWMHLDHMLKFLFLDATWSFKIKMITFARLYKPLLEDDSSSFTLVQSWNFDPARSRLNFFYPSKEILLFGNKNLKLSGSHVNQRFLLFLQHWYKFHPLAKTWAFIWDDPSSKMRNHLKLNLNLENASWRWWKLENISFKRD